MKDVTTFSRDRPADAPTPISVGFVGSIGRTCFSDLLLRACPRIETAYRTGSRQTLLAALRSRRLDIAIYPGAPAPDPGAILLCEDHLVVAAHRSHRLVGRPAIRLAQLRDTLLLLPAEGEESDFRRLVQGLLPDLGRVVEAPIRDIGARLAATGALALVAAGQRDELGRDIVTRPIAARDTRFPVHVSWSGDVRGEGWRELFAALAENAAAVSSPASGRL